MGGSNFLFLSRRRELNPRPADYESAAMPLSHGGAIPHNIALCHNKPNEDHDWDITFFGACIPTPMNTGAHE